MPMPNNERNADVLKSHVKSEVLWGGASGRFRARFRYGTEKGMEKGRRQKRSPARFSHLLPFVGLKPKTDSKFGYSNPCSNISNPFSLVFSDDAPMALSFTHDVPACSQMGHCLGGEAL